MYFYCNWVEGLVRVSYRGVSNEENVCLRISSVAEIETFQVICQKSAGVFDHDIKHEKVYEALGAKPRQLFIAFKRFDIIVKHERKFLI